MASFKEHLKEHPIVTSLAALASLAAVISFCYWIYTLIYPAIPDFSASGRIFTADSVAVPGAVFSYSFNNGDFHTDSADSQGYYQIIIQSKSTRIISFHCNARGQSIETAVRAVNPDNLTQNIYLKKSQAASIPTAQPDQTAIKPKRTAIGSTQQLAGKDTFEQESANVNPEMQLKEQKHLPQYVLKPQNNGSLIPYYSNNPRDNANDSPAGFLNDETPINTLFIPTYADNDWIQFSFVDENIHRLTKGWIQLKHLQLKNKF